MIFIFYPLFAFALPEDSHAKIHIVADSSIYNYKNGTSIFEGHVQVDQGTTHITADRLITKNDSQHKIHEAIAYGLQKPAHYWTLPKRGEKRIYAKAEVIKFYPMDANITLKNNVSITQGENYFQGQLILFNNTDQTITVPKSSPNRSVLIYNPES